jgi:hypothetical protein
VQVKRLNPAPIASAQAIDRLIGQFVADARFYDGLSRVGRSGVGSLAWTILHNPGLWLLTSHRFAGLCKSVGAGFNIIFCRSQFAEDCERQRVLTPPASSPHKLASLDAIAWEARSVPR